MEAGSYGSDPILLGAKSRFDQYVDKKNSVHPDIRSVVFGLAAQLGDRSTYDTMWDLYNKATLQEEKVRFLASLGKFQSAELLTETLERSLSSEVRIHAADRTIKQALERISLNSAWIERNRQELDSWLN